jgi:hypothetical protein
MIWAKGSGLCEVIRQVRDGDRLYSSNSSPVGSQATLHRRNCALPSSYVVVRGILLLAVSSPLEPPCSRGFRIQHGVSVRQVNRGPPSAVEQPTPSGLRPNAGLAGEETLFVHPKIVKSRSGVSIRVDVILGVDRLYSFTLGGNTIPHLKRGVDNLAHGLERHVDGAGFLVV